MVVAAVVVVVGGGGGVVLVVAVASRAGHVYVRARARPRTHACTHARTHTNTHTRTHTLNMPVHPFGSNLSHPRPQRRAQIGVAQPARCKSRVRVRRCRHHRRRRPKRTKNQEKRVLGATRHVHSAAHETQLLQQVRTRCQRVDVCAPRHIQRADLNCFPAEEMVRLDNRHQRR